MSTSNPYAPYEYEPSVIQATGEAQVDQVEEVPDGTAGEILDWVGDDAGRAQSALDKELAGNKRKTLVAKLEDLLPNKPEGDAAKGEPTVVQAEEDREVPADTDEEAADKA